MELDPIGKYQVWKLRKDQAKDLKTVRKTSNKLMSGLLGHRNTAYDLAQDAAKKTREEAMKKIKEGSKKRIKMGKRAAVVGTLAGGGYALNKLMKDEKLYSLILTESQLQRLYSKMEDQDYLDEQEKRKESVKHAKGVGTATGALVGAGLGHSLGRGKGKLIGATAGAVGGGVLGRYAGKSIKKRTEDDANKKITRYKNSSEHDKKYLREKNEKEKDRRIQERQARAMESTAWHTSRLYSKKEEYLNGKETKLQEISRNNLTGSLVGLGTTLGAVVGSGTAKNKNFERALKITKNAHEDNEKVIGALEKMVTKFKEKGSRFKDQQSKDAFEGVLKWGEQRVNNNIKGVNKALKVAKAMDNKATLKRGLKGAAIGTAVMAPLAYAANKSMKNRNEKINRSRRGKKE